MNFPADPAMNLLHTLLGRPSVPANSAINLVVDTAPTLLSAAGATDFQIASVLRISEGLPTFDWSAVHAWLATIPDAAEQARAYATAELAWLAYLREALEPVSLSSQKPAYRLMKHGDALLLSSLEPVLARATLDFMADVAQHIPEVLDGLTQPHGWGYDILIVLDDLNTYYRYVARYDHKAGNYAGSSGVFIQEDCKHFVTCKANKLDAMESVIAHEMTHAYLAHLPLPLWLNEGLAVNTEHRLVPSYAPAGIYPNWLSAHNSIMQQYHKEHRAYWNTNPIQQFWSGEQFNTVDGQTLSYNLATLLVSLFARNWERFRAFTLQAHAADAGQTSALAHLGLGLGDAVSALLERPDMATAWQPVPERWPVSTKSKTDPDADAAPAHHILQN